MSARIELGAQTYALQGRLNGKPAALLAIYQLPGTNAVKTAQGVRALMEEAKTRFPQGLDYVIPLDTTLAVTEGLKEIEHTLFEAIALVILVVFIFLQGWRATLIPLLAVPVSLVGTFILFPMLGFSINTLSLFGLVLGDRIGGRRCHCGGGSCRAPHRTWIVAERSDRQSNGRGIRSCRCHRIDPLRGVYPHGVHSRNHRQDVSTIRGHHCGFGHLLGIQCAHFESGAFRQCC